MAFRMGTKRRMVQIFTNAPIPGSTGRPSVKLSFLSEVHSSSMDEITHKFNEGVQYLSSFV